MFLLLVSEHESDDDAVSELLRFETKDFEFYDIVPRVTPLYSAYRV